jgi:hypothetical protein
MSPGHSESGSHRWQQRPAPKANRSLERRPRAGSTLVSACPGLVGTPADGSNYRRFRARSTESLNALSGVMRTLRDAAILMGSPV